MRRAGIALGSGLLVAVLVILWLGRREDPSRVAGVGERPGTAEAIAAVAAAGGEGETAGGREQAVEVSAVRVRVYVRDEDGAPIPNATVSLRPQRRELQSPDGSPFARGTTGADGHVSLRAQTGGWWVTADPPESEADRFGQTGAEAALAAGEQELHLVLPALDAALCVLVHDDLAEPLADVLIAVEIPWLRTREARTDPRGRAWFDRMPAARTRVRVDRGDLARSAHYAKESALNFDVVVSRRGLMTAHFEAVRAAQVRLVHPPADASRTEYAIPVRLHGNGDYYPSGADVLARSGAPPSLVSVAPGRYGVDASVPAHVDLAASRIPEFELAPGEVRDLSIPLRREQGRITGLVLAPDGSPAANLSLTCHARDAAGRPDLAGSKLMRTDREGRFLVRGVPEGTHVIEPYVSGYRGIHCRYPDFDRMRYSTGSQDVVIQLQVGHRVRGRLLRAGKPSSDGEVQIEPGRFRGVYDSTSPENGRFTFSHLAPGMHHIVWRIDGRVVCECKVDIPDLPESAVVEAELSTLR